MGHPAEEISGQSHSKMEQVVSKGGCFLSFKGKKGRETFIYLSVADNFCPSSPLIKHWGILAEAG